MKWFLIKQGLQGPQELSSLKSLKIQNPFLKTQECAIKLKKCLPYQIPGGKTVRNVQIDPQTTEICPKKLSDSREAELLKILSDKELKV